MGTEDISFFESGNGGDIAKSDSDILLTQQIFNQGILAFFGGNIEASTTGSELPSQIRQDYWQNSLFFQDDPAKQFNSLTQKALLDNPLTSTGRINIIRAVETDIQYLKNIADVEVNVVILSTNKLQIILTLTQPGTKQVSSLQILWDNLQQELIIDKVI